MSEFALIERFFKRPARRPDVLLGSGDDAALLQVPSHANLVLTVDTLISGKHFFAHAPAQAVAQKVLAVNLSDLAAMGAEPAWVSLALSLPEANVAWLQAFSDALFAALARYGVDLVGGDLTRGPLTLSMQALGWLEPGWGLKRSLAQLGDDIYVTGPLGAAAMAVRLHEQGRSSPNAEHYFQAACFPEPQVEWGRFLRTRAHAAIDVSDGLAQDLGHILRASGVGARLEVERIPVDSVLLGEVAEQEAFTLALTGGDDYQLCFTAAREQRRALEERGLRPIGEIVAGGGLACWYHGRPFEGAQAGFDHFREGV